MAVVEQAPWTQAQVEKGRSLVVAEEQSKWALGDLALEIVPPGGNLGILAAFAIAIGMEPGTLEQYRIIAERFPAKDRTLNASWTVYRELMTEPHLVKVLSDKRRKPPGGRWTVDAVRQMRGKEPRNSPTTTQGKAETVRRLMRDPEVAAAATNGQDSEDPLTRLAAEIESDGDRTVDAYIQAAWQAARALHLHLRSNEIHFSSLDPDEAVRMLTEALTALDQSKIRLMQLGSREVAAA